MQKRKLSVKRCLCVFIAALMILTVPVSHTETVNAASGSGWKKSYESILNNWRRAEKYCDTSYLKMYFGRDYKFNQYFLYDLNRNGTPELFLHSTTMGLTIVFTYNGRLRSLGYYDIYGFNTDKKELIVRGHWHGAGGSGVNEWTIYKMGSSWMQGTYTMDKMNGNYSVYNMQDGSFTGSSKMYNAIYSQHIRNCKRMNSFTRYKLSDRGRLNAHKTPGKVAISSVSRAGSGKLKITWKKVSGATGYQIYRSTQKNSGYRRIKNLSSKSSSYTNSKLKNGKRYYYKIRAYKRIDGKTYYGKFSNIKYQSPKGTVSVIGRYRRDCKDYGITTIKVYKKNGNYYAKAYGRGGKMNTTVRLYKNGSRYTAYYFGSKKNDKFFELSSISSKKAVIKFPRIPEFNGSYARL